MNHCEWRSCNHKSEVATWWRNATDNVHPRWPPAEPTDVGQRARCSLAHFRQFPLERLASLMLKEFHVAGSWRKFPVDVLESRFTRGSVAMFRLHYDRK